MNMQNLKFLVYPVPENKFCDRQTGYWNKLASSVELTLKRKMAG